MHSKIKIMQDTVIWNACTKFELNRKHLLNSSIKYSELLNFKFQR